MTTRRSLPIAAVVAAMAPIACNTLTAVLTPLPTPIVPPPAPTPMSPSPTPAPSSTPVPTPGLVEVTVYFTDMNRFATGSPPFEVGVARRLPENSNWPEAVLGEFFAGPTPEERARGLEAVTSGFTGFSEVRVQDGIARVYLTGSCISQGAMYTVAQPIIRNLLQLPEIRAVKIYDSAGTTGQPEGESNSIPACLEP